MMRLFIYCSLLIDGKESEYLLFLLNKFKLRKISNAKLIIKILKLFPNFYDRDDIINTLNNGTHIVCDRYAFSGVVYSAAKGVGNNIKKHSF